MFDDLIPQKPSSSGGLFDDLIPKQAVDSAKAALAEGLRSGKSGNLETYRTAAFRTNQGVPGANATDSAVRGLTLGLSDELSATSRAPIDMAIRGEEFGEAYQHNLAAERDRYEKFRSANPVKAFAAEAVGGLANPVRVGGPISTGAVLGGVTAFGNSEGDLGQRGTDAATGGALGGALGGVVSGVARVVGGRAPSATPSISELKAEATRLYNSPAVKELAVSPKVLTDFSETVLGRMGNDGFSAELSPATFAILSRVGKAPDGSVVSGQNLDTLRKTLSKVAGSSNSEEKAAASFAIEALDDHLANINPQYVLRGDAKAASEAFDAARGNWNAARQAEKIDRKTVEAEIRAGAANSGMNVANTVRQRMADVAIRPAEQRGMRPEEIAQAERIARGTTAQNILRGAGNVLGGGGGLGTVAAATAGGMATGGPGAALPVLGFALRGLGNKLTLRQAENLSEAIRSRAPLASSSTKFEEKAAAFVDARNAKTAAAAALAARNLSTNLRSAGFDVSASDLMRGLQSGAVSRAEDQQPEIPRPPGQ